ncbi:Rieske [2Fe-2S] domain-containing protein [Pseudomonas asplenii]|uniref:Rieske [2Fe-2S] domain-containing protein n=2 Tax=Pseudomonas asplenii TaxID=53407 RepID=A0A1H6P1H1_9PSED|nr:Rieske 2Fe-2S domain-containing protein [Pseudomonas fuscovaginae]SEI17464.1 Rieske [2Fe-2S] domain-containing protein [Pseudomonas fuscovaginae]
MLDEPEVVLRPATFLVRIGEEEYEVPSLCPHREGWLEHGMVNQSRRTITCPLHFSVFSLETGEQLGGPPCGSISCRKIK